MQVTQASRGTEEPQNSTPGPEGGRVFCICPLLEQSISAHKGRDGLPSFSSSEGAP